VKAGWVILLFAVAMCLSFVGGRCSAPRTSFSEAPLPDPAISPPDTIRITLIRRVPVEDPTWRNRYDSLVSALTVDSAALYLAQPWAEEHVWGFDRYGARVAGRLSLISHPTLKLTEPTLTLDTLKLPPVQVKIETVETISIPWMIAIAAAGTGLGIWIGSR
jgi:hypothetical protein